jgi:hypothetical protein
MLRELRKLCLLAIGALPQDRDMMIDKAETAFSSSFGIVGSLRIGMSKT